MHHGHRGEVQVSKIENPDKSGINTSNYVGKYTVPSVVMQVLKTVM